MVTSTAAATTPQASGQPLGARATGRAGSVLRSHVPPAEPQPEGRQAPARASSVGVPSSAGVVASSTP